MHSAHPTRNPPDHRRHSPGLHPRPASGAKSGSHGRTRATRRYPLQGPGSCGFPSATAWQGADPLTIPHGRRSAATSGKSPDTRAAIATALGQRAFELRVLAKGRAQARDAARCPADGGEALLQRIGDLELPGLGDGGQGRAGIAVAGPAADVVREGLRPAPGPVDPTPREPLDGEGPGRGALRAHRSHPHPEPPPLRCAGGSPVPGRRAGRTRRPPPRPRRPAPAGAPAPSPRRCPRFPASLATCSSPRVFPHTYLCETRPLFPPAPPEPSERAFRGLVSARRQTAGCVFARRFLLIRLSQLRAARTFLFSPAGFARPLFSPAPRRRRFSGRVFARMQTEGAVFARSFSSIPIRRLRESGRAVFSPAGNDQSLFSPAPRSRRALEHSRRAAHRGERAGFSTPFPAVASGDLGHAPFALVYRQ